MARVHVGVDRAAVQGRAREAQDGHGLSADNGGPGDCDADRLRHDGGGVRPAFELRQHHDEEQHGPLPRHFRLLLRRFLDHLRRPTSDHRGERLRLRLVVFALLLRNDCGNDQLRRARGPRLLPRLPRAVDGAHRRDLPSRCAVGVGRWLVERARLHRLRRVLAGAHDRRHWRARGRLLVWPPHRKISRLSRVDRHLEVRVRRAQRERVVPAPRGGDRKSRVHADQAVQQPSPVALRHFLVAGWVPRVQPGLHVGNDLQPRLGVGQNDRYHAHFCGCRRAVVHRLVCD
mmetsp:Transcript_51426/g.148399  ORF Transcript_51426/g.148399 Transcript_51426/m.148399 type:complete len:288 (-) Transcript_51426:1266-2129(-)